MFHPADEKRWRWLRGGGGEEEETVVVVWSFFC
jgi:hypothetical protein